MPLWVIVAESDEGEPIVLTDFVMGEQWASAAAARARDVRPCIFRDRWRAKRQTHLLDKALTPRAIRLDRL